MPPGTPVVQASVLTKAQRGLGRLREAMGCSGSNECALVGTDQLREALVVPGRAHDAVEGSGSPTEV